MAKELKNSEPLVIAAPTTVISEAGPEPIALSEDDKCEIIETAIDDLDLLSRAFSVIRNACEEMQAPISVDFMDIPDDAVIH